MLEDLIQKYSLQELPAPVRKWYDEEGKYPYIMFSCRGVPQGSDDYEQVKQGILEELDFMVERYIQNTRGRKVAVRRRYQVENDEGRLHATCRLVVM